MGGFGAETAFEVVEELCKPVGDVEKPDELRGEIRSLVKENLAAYECPREIAFVEELPTTTTGKIRRTDLRDRTE
jgi:acetyl-CoA synthetase